MSTDPSLRPLSRVTAVLVTWALTGLAAVHAQGQPNILVIWGDDVGWQNVSAYGMGTMGHTTPNIDMNNLPYWKGETDRSAHDSLFYYYESKLTAVRMGPWKFHFSTKEDYYADLVPRTAPLVFNLRMDPFESFDMSNVVDEFVKKAKQ
jgi:arylsulfatase A-like enzyme